MDEGLRAHLSQLDDLSVRFTPHLSESDCESVAQTVSTRNDSYQRMKADLTEISETTQSCIDEVSVYILKGACV